MCKINIITQLLSFFMLAAVINLLNINILLIVLMILVAILMLNKTPHFWRSIKRFKWLFLVMIAIFSFNTPGEHLANWPFSISPTYEGITAGLTQVLRIFVMLATLSLILATNTRQQLISGFYFIFLPLKHLGLKVERFAARLWLTLHYVELQRKSNVNRDFFSRLRAMTALDSGQIDEDVSINFEIPQFRLIDYAAIALLAFVLIQYVFNRALV